MKHLHWVALIVSIAGMRSDLASAAEPDYCATLGGAGYGEVTGSTATGLAKLKIDQATQMIDLQVNVEGIGIDELSDKLKSLPIGPIHLHVYATQDRSADADVALALPLPFGPGYQETEGGFTAEMTGISYAEAATKVASELTFDQFVDAVNEGRMVLNIHTNRYPAGEISGPVSADCAGQLGHSVVQP